VLNQALAVGCEPLLHFLLALLPTRTQSNLGLSDHRPAKETDPAAFVTKKLNLRRDIRIVTGYYRL